jgi:hypothetical protein
MKLIWFLRMIGNLGLANARHAPVPLNTAILLMRAAAGPIGIITARIANGHRSACPRSRTQLAA